MKALGNIPFDREAGLNREALLWEDLVACVEVGEIHTAKKRMEAICLLRSTEDDSSELAMATLLHALHTYRHPEIEVVLRDCGLSKMNDSQIARHTGYSTRQIRRIREKIKKIRKSGQICPGRSSLNEQGFQKN
jgi:uncharacterized protein involved in tolerance to divalent cations